MPQIFPENNYGNEHQTPNIIRKYLEEAKVEVSSPRSEPSDWETGTGLFYTIHTTCHIFTLDDFFQVILYNPNRFEIFHQKIQFFLSF